MCVDGSGGSMAVRLTLLLGKKKAVALTCTTVLGAMKHPWALKRRHKLLPAAQAVTRDSKGPPVDKPP